MPPLIYPQNLDKEFAELTSNIFKEDLAFAFINGRAAFFINGGPQMDIDICVVLKDQITLKEEQFKEGWGQFVEGYRDLHLKYNFLPDSSFPGDFLTIAQAYEAAQGRGFVSYNGKPYLAPMSSINDENNENDYRIFRSMFIVGRAIIGNEPLFNELKLSCLKTIIKYFFTLIPKLSLQQIIDEFLSGKEKEKYGFDHRYEPYFSTYLTPMLDSCLDALTTEGFIHKQMTSPPLYEKTAAIDNWGEIVLSRVWTAHHLMPFSSPYFKQQREVIFKGTQAASHWEKLVI